MYITEVIQGKQSWSECKQTIVDMRYGYFYTKYREDEEKQANFLSKEASQFILEMTTSFTNAAMVTEI